MGHWVCVTVIAQINTCSSSGAHSPKALLTGSAVFLGQGTLKCWPPLMKATNWRGLVLHTGFRGGSLSLSSAPNRKTDHVPDAWNCLLRKAAPTVLLFTLISDSLKRCCILLLSLLWVSFPNVERRIKSYPSSLANVTFKVRWNTLPFYRSHQVFMGILATRVKFFLRLQEVSGARGD